MEIVNPGVLWLTGLPGSGKSTIGRGVYKLLRQRDCRTEHLDGDEVRKVFPGTGYDKNSRNMHIRRIGYLASLLERNQVFVVASFISPYIESRQFVRNICLNYIEVYLSTPLEVCMRRDPKGLYARAKQGDIVGLTGFDDPYEVPLNPDLILDTSLFSIEECIIKVAKLII